jgi:hypothetical protein
MAEWERAELFKKRRINYNANVLIVGLGGVDLCS